MSVGSSAYEALDKEAAEELLGSIDALIAEVEAKEKVLGKEEETAVTTSTLAETCSTSGMPVPPTSSIHTKGRLPSAAKMNKLKSCEGPRRPAKEAPWQKIWENRLKELGEYKKRNGNANVPRSYRLNPQLGRCIDAQRRGYQKRQRGQRSSMTAERIKALEELGFMWKFHDSYHWEERLEELQQYIKKHGNANVPQSYGPNPVLGRWVSTQRAEFRKMQRGQHSFMTAERINALEELGFVWTIQKHANASWDSRLEELRQFKLIHGHTNVPKNYQPNSSLGIWCRTQRSEYRKLQRGQSSGMTAERLNALKELGFVWKLR